MFDDALVRSVSMDSVCDQDVDPNKQTATAFVAMARSLGEEGDEEADEMHAQEVMAIVNGAMVDQFQPMFFLTAFAFLFPWGTGAPDLKNYERQRRPNTRMEVDFVQHWGKLLMQRAEGQWRRDLMLPFALWNLTFRTLMYTSASLYNVHQLASKGVTTQGERFCGEDFRDAAMCITKCLHGEYTQNGKKFKVNGDLAKVKHCDALTPTARRMLHDVQATMRHIEVCNAMVVSAC